MPPYSRLWNKSRTQNRGYCLLLPSSFCFSETLINTNQTAQCHTPENIRIFHNHHRKNVISSLVNEFRLIMKSQCVFYEVRTDYFKYYWG